VIPIIDIFAGPGGLGEGFCSLLDKNNKRRFKISLSIEKDFYAHQTLTLRSFFRQFDLNKVPEEYYKFVRNEISLEDLYEAWPEQAATARHEAWRATLGEGDGAVSDESVDERIRLALKSASDWVLIGGPPCQAYSVVGRNRRKDILLDESKDERVGLYKQYLRILAVHNPSVFVMENVKGLLSAETKESPIFSKILTDLADPGKAYKPYQKTNSKLLCPGYKIYSLVVKPEFDKNGNPILTQKDYVICTEKHGIPQTRHRIILLGIRRDINFIPDVLPEMKEIAISKVIADLPKLRGGLSKIEDGNSAWKRTVEQTRKKVLLEKIDKKIKKEILEELSKLTVPRYGRGAEFIKYKHAIPAYLPEWFSDSRLGGVCNHSSRGHMESDLHRYFYISCFAAIKGFSPNLDDLPHELLPSHQNVFKKDGGVTGKFPDRFRVQLKNRPSKTITSHISQDGHYYIHYDPQQCRSFTVREAARIQTFPDNYFFCGPKTHQFIQVGNAVPPLLANKIAEIVIEIFRNPTDKGRSLLTLTPRVNAVAELETI
jgi:DNA (cytosine-5)-methyltransferase 1